MWVRFFRINTEGLFSSPGHLLLSRRCYQSSQSPVTQLPEWVEGANNFRSLFLANYVLLVEMPQASEPAQQQVSCTRDRLHGQQQSHDQIAADVQASCMHGMTNQRLQGCGAQQQGGEQ